jgi:hypothetical protein
MLHLRLLHILSKQLPLKNTSIPASTHKPRVILKPRNTSDFTRMPFKLHGYWVLSRVEVEDLDYMPVCCGEKMASVSKLDLSTGLNRELFIRFDAITKHIHHPQFVSETDDDVKAGRVESDAVGLFGKLLQNF